MFFIFVFLSYSLLNIKTNALTVEQVNRFPNYLYMYFLQFLGPSLIGILIAIFQYLRHREMRHSIFMEMRDCIVCFE